MKTHTHPIAYKKRKKQKNFENLDERMHWHTHTHTPIQMVESYKQTNRCKSEKCENEKYHIYVQIR